MKWRVAIKWKHENKIKIKLVNFQKLKQSFKLFNWKNKIFKIETCVCNLSINEFFWSGSTFNSSALFRIPFNPNECSPNLISCSVERATNCCNSSSLLVIRALKTIGGNWSIGYQAVFRFIWDSSDLSALLK